MQESVIRGPQPTIAEWWEKHNYGVLAQPNDVALNRTSRIWWLDLAESGGKGPQGCALTG